MQTWWFKRKISQFIAFVQYIKIVPDLKLRSFVIIVSFCLIISSFFLGLILGRQIEAKRAISITNATKHISYNKKVLEQVDYMPKMKVTKILSLQTVVRFITISHVKVLVGLRRKIVCGLKIKKMLSFLVIPWQKIVNIKI